MTEFPTCSTCRFLVNKACWRMPPIDKYGERPPIAYPDKEWCGEHAFAEGPATRASTTPPAYTLRTDEVPLPVVAPTNDPRPTVASSRPTVLPLSSPPVSASKPKK